MISFFCACCSLVVIAPLITDALWHNSGLQPWGSIERWLYTVTWPLARTQTPSHSDRVTYCHNERHWKWAKWTPIWAVGNPDPIWAKCLKSGQNFSRSGQKKIIHILLRAQIGTENSLSSHISIDAALQAYTIWRNYEQQAHPTHLFWRKHRLVVVKHVYHT